MTLSKDQLRCVSIGLGPSFWTPYNLLDVRLPPVPQWIEDLYVDFHPGYSNGPSVKIWSTHDPMAPLLDHRKPIWDYNPASSLYIARLEDGRAHAYSAPPPAIDHLEAHVGDTTIEYATWTTLQGEGFGGRHFPITMRDGRRVVLRGPWHASVPGDEGITLIEPRPPKAAKPTLWHQKGGMFGLFLPQLLLVSAIHKFHPDYQFADVTLDGVQSIDAYKREWAKPKAAMSAAERQQWSL